ncbi:MAG: RNA polymerase sigma factor FliA [Pseudomonadota bacterium]
MSGVAKYKATQKKTQKERPEDMVKKYAPLVKRIAYHLMGRLPPTVQADDLIQSGMIGLLEAARNYDETQGASFETYAGIRVRGAMLDEIRKNDWVPRSVHKKSRMLAEVIREIENRTGRDARDSEIAEALGVTTEEYHKLLKEAGGQRVFSFDEIGLDGTSLSETYADDRSGPLDGLQSDGFREHLMEAISSLPERERLVMGLYYDEELNLREIGAIIGVSESRVSQIHSQAVIRLQARLTPWTKP